MQQNHRSHTLFAVSCLLAFAGNAQPPNNTTCTALNILVEAGNSFGEPCIPTTTYSWVGATDKGFGGLNCSLYNGAKSTWYKFTVPASGDFGVSLAPADGNYNTEFLGGYQIALFSVDKCASPSGSSYYCSDYSLGGNSINYPTVTFRDQTPGTVHYFAVWRQGGGADGTVKMCITALQKIAASSQKAGVGITSPRKTFDVNGDLHVQSNLSVLGKLGIGTPNPQYPLDITGRIRLRANNTYGAESAGLSFNRQDNSQGAVFLGLANDSIFGIYGNYGSDWFGFNMNRLSGLVTMGRGYKAAYHVGRYTIKKDPTTGAGETSGIWLNNNANTGGAAFMGLFNDNLVGLYGSGYGWGLAMNTSNGNVGIRLNGGSPTRPLSFPAEIGEKILLYPGPNGEVGIGVYGNELRLHSDNPGAKVSFGTQDNNGVFTEVGKFEKNGAYGLSVFGSIWANGTTYASDGRFKKNVEPLEDALDKVLQLQGVTYQMKAEEFPNQSFDESVQVGLIAQDVEKVVPEVVTTGPGGYKAIDYAKLVPLLIESIKQQQARLDAQQREIDALKKQAKRK